MPLVEVLRDAVLSGSQEALDALVAAGMPSVECFHDAVRRKGSIELPPGRDTVDGLSHVAHVLGRRLPHEFLSVFSAEKHSFAIMGLGASGLPEAQPILIEVLRSRALWTSRIDAAIGLRNLPGRRSVEALLKATQSRQYLIRYHAVDSLAVIGDESAVTRLSKLAGDPADRGVSERATLALEALARRGIS